MSYLDPIYGVWGGNAEALAADIGELGVTVRQWRNRGRIPVTYWPRIIAAAAQRGETLELDQFLPPLDAPTDATPSPDIPAGSIGGDQVEAAQ